MSKENEVIEKDDEKEVEVDDIVETKDDEGKDTTDWKALALKNQGIAKRLKTKLDKKPKAKPPVKKKESVPKEKKGFDYAEKAFLVAKGYKRKKEQEHAWQVMQDTGKSLDEVLRNKYFKSEIKEMRELKASSDAIPSGTKRTTKSMISCVVFLGRPILGLFLPLPDTPSLTHLRNVE